MATLARLPESRPSADPSSCVALGKLICLFPQLKSGNSNSSHGVMCKYLLCVVCICVAGASPHCCSRGAGGPSAHSPLSFCPRGSSTELNIRQGDKAGARTQVPPSC